MAKFRVGEVVRLNSGSLPMTVTGHSRVSSLHPEQTQVAWFQSDGDSNWYNAPLFAEFPEDALTLHKT